MINLHLSMSAYIALSKIFIPCIPYNGNNSRKKKFAICPALFYSRENIRECKTILLKYKYTIHSAHAIQQENVRECTRNRENREHFLSRTIPDIRYFVHNCCMNKCDYMNMCIFRASPYSFSMWYETKR